jgi:aldehyde:ferredoxin oxidoreductase
MRDTILVGRASCFGCPVSCKRIVKVSSPRYDVDPAYGGPEYETIAAFGSNCGIGDLETIAKANELCNAYGLDTISTGVTLSFAMECFEKGLLNKDMTGGLTLRFGGAPELIHAIELIAHNRGFGQVLGKGTREVAGSLGPDAESCAMQIKGQELPLQDPRRRHGQGLGYAVSPTGADHCHASVDHLYAFEGPYMDRIRALGILEPLPFSDLSAQKVRMFTYDVFWWTLYNCLPLCANNDIYSQSQCAEIVRATTGWNSTTWELAKVGERALTMARAFNVREGFTPADDRLPSRFFSTSEPTYHTVAALNPHQLHDAIRMHYEMMGWDPQTGVPRQAKLEELGIGWVGERMGM